MQRFRDVASALSQRLSSGAEQISRPNIFRVARRPEVPVSENDAHPPPPKKTKKEEHSLDECLDVGCVPENKVGTPLSVTKGLPEPPFLLTVVAPRKSGKTNLVVDLLLGENKLKGKFDVILIWSKTASLDGKWKNIQLPLGSIFEDFHESDLETIVSTIERVNAEVRINTLLIFDDMVTEGIMNARKLGSMDSVAVRGRHSNISLIVITQQYMAISPPVRNNTTNMVIFRVRNGDEQEKITRENREHLTADEFKDMFHRATEKPFSFLHINNQRQDPQERFQQNWIGPINGSVDEE
jgi:hypothetical protein